MVVAGHGRVRGVNASGLTRAGCHVATVQRTFGYSDAAATLKTCSHLRTEGSQNPAELARQTLNRNSTTSPSTIT